LNSIPQLLGIVIQFPIGRPHNVIINVARFFDFIQTTQTLDYKCILTSRNIFGKTSVIVFQF